MSTGHGVFLHQPARGWAATTLCLSRTHVFMLPSGPVFVSLDFFGDPQHGPPGFMGQAVTLAQREAGCPHAGCALGWDGRLTGPAGSRERRGLVAGSGGLRSWPPHPGDVRSPFWTVPCCGRTGRGCLAPPDSQAHFLRQTHDFRQNQFPHTPPGRGGGKPGLWAAHSLTRGHRQKGLESRAAPHTPAAACPARQRGSKASCWRLKGRGLGPCKTPSASPRGSAASCSPNEHKPSGPGSAGPTACRTWR